MNQDTKIGQVTVGINDFARRHTEHSKYSYYAGDIEKVAQITADAINSGRSILRSIPSRVGVHLVCVPAEGFFSGVVEVNPETKLKAALSPRQEGEESYIQVTALDGKKLPAQYVDICLYEPTALEPDEPSTDCDLEVVSINASPWVGEEPPTPMAMARNHLGLPGSSESDYTPDEFAESIIYWSRRAMCG